MGVMPPKQASLLGFSTNVTVPSCKGHRYPVEIINHCVWLCFRFTLSFRGVEELMLERGVVVSYETIRRWCTKFRQVYANQLRRRRTTTRRQVAPRRGVWLTDRLHVASLSRVAAAFVRRETTPTGRPW